MTFSGICLDTWPGMCPVCDCHFRLLSAFSARSNEVPHQMDGARGCIWEEVLDQIWRLVIWRASLRDHHIWTCTISR